MDIAVRAAKLSFGAFRSNSSYCDMNMKRTYDCISKQSGCR